jgi:hypothetical protein
MLALAILFISSIVVLFFDRRLARLAMLSSHWAASRQPSTWSVSHISAPQARFSGGYHAG